MKPTVPRTKKNLRQLLMENPGWYRPRADYEPRRSEDIIKAAKKWRVWTKAWKEPMSDDPEHFWICQMDEQWKYCGNGAEPTSGFREPGVILTPLEEFILEAQKAALTLPYWAKRR